MKIPSWFTLLKIRHYPYDLNLELTSVCNLDCNYCIRSESISKCWKDSGNITNDLLIKILEEYKTLPSYHHQKITPCGLGEPLLYPNIRATLLSIRRVFPKAEIATNTNGLLLNDNLIDSGLDYLTVSVNWSNRNEYYHMNGSDSFKVIEENLLRFLMAKKNRKPRTIVQVMEIAEDVKGFCKFWKPLLSKDDIVYVRPFTNWGMFKSSNLTKRRPCFALWSTLMISKEGNVYPCCISEAYGGQSNLLLGNIQEASLKTILANGKLDAIRWMHRKGRCEELYPCKNCDAWLKMPRVPF